MWVGHILICFIFKTWVFLYRMDIWTWYDKFCVCRKTFKYYILKDHKCSFIHQNSFKFKLIQIHIKFTHVYGQNKLELHFKNYLIMYMSWYWHTSVMKWKNKSHIYQGCSRKGESFELHLIFPKATSAGESNGWHQRNEKHLSNIK